MGEKDSRAKKVQRPKKGSPALFRLLGRHQSWQSAATRLVQEFKIPQAVVAMSIEGGRFRRIPLIYRPNGIFAFLFPSAPAGQILRHREIPGGRIRQVRKHGARKRVREQPRSCRVHPISCIDAASHVWPWVRQRGVRNHEHGARHSNGRQATRAATLSSSSRTSGEALFHL